MNEQEQNNEEMHYNSRLYRYDHLKGRNDDCVFADALAWQAAEQMVSGNYFETGKKKFDEDKYFEELDKYIELNKHLYDYESNKDY